MCNDPSHASHGDLDFRVVTPNTIEELSRITKWTQAELWKEYRKAVQKKTAVIILVSDLSLADALDAAASYSKGKCYYVYSRKLPYQDQWICGIHKKPCAYAEATKDTRMPCEAVAEPGGIGRGV